MKQFSKFSFVVVEGLHGYAMSTKTQTRLPKCACSAEVGLSAYNADRNK